LKYYETQKLFYGKYLYKICFYNQLNGIFRTEFQKNGTLSYAREKLDGLKEDYRHGNAMKFPIYRTWRSIDSETYFGAQHTYYCLLKNKDYKIRVESFGSMSIFTNDYNLIEKIAKGLKSERISIYKPDDDIKNDLLTKKNIIISNNPVEWPYKVTLGNLRRDYTGFANWIDNNPDKIKIGEIARHSLTDHGYVSGYYFFVKSEKMLNLINIMVGDNIRRIDQIVYKENIDK
jgi:hypothetical protein